MQPLTIRAKVKISEYSHLSTIQDQSDFEYDVRMRLAQELMPELIKVMQVHKIQSNQRWATEYIGEVVAMKYDDWMANYASHHSRRGIADGTMAIMHNGNWKVVGAASSPPAPVPYVKVEAKVEQKAPTPKKFDPSEYLKQRVSELQNGSKS